MRYKAILSGLSSALLLLPVLGTLCGCTWKDLFPSDTPTVPNAVAVDRALDLCSLTHGGQPFHLILTIGQPVRARSEKHRSAEVQSHAMQAQVEIFWLSPIAYRTVVHSAKFNQVRIVNGGAIEEHDTGDFYPRWLQNFVDALLDPVPRAASLRRQPGAIPVSLESHACISNSGAPAVGDETSAQICFQDVEPRLASGIDFTRYVSYDDYAPFGSQQIARTLINDLPANLLLRAHVTLLEPFPKSAYPLLKATQYTPPSQQVRTMLVSRSMAQSLLESSPVSRPPHIRFVSRETSPRPAGPATHTIVYIRTDRTGRVREAYPDSNDVYGLHQAAALRALTLKFKPLIVNGAPQQMEAPLEMP